MPQENLSLESLIDEILQGNESETEETEDVDTEEVDTTLEETEESEESEESEEQEDDVEPEDETETEESEKETEPPAKKVQSKEENAKFAALRRQKEMELFAKQQMESSPQYKIAQKMAELYGVPVEQLLDQVDEAIVQKKAKELNQTPEQIREKQQTDEKINELQDNYNRLMYQNWEMRVSAEAAAIKSQYPTLTDDDINTAKDYILNTVQNVNMTMQQAVYAVHGEKIINSRIESKLQEELAKQSGRAKNTPPTPKSSGKADTEAYDLTADELEVAKIFRMKPEEYAKYKK